MHFCAPTSKTGVLVHLLTRNGFLVPCWVPCGHFIHLFVVFVPPCINHRRLAHCSVLCAAGSSCLVLAHPPRQPGCHMHAPTLYNNSHSGPSSCFLTLSHVFSSHFLTLSHVSSVAVSLMPQKFKKLSENCRKLPPKIRISAYAAVSAYSRPLWGNQFRVGSTLRQGRHLTSDSQDLPASRVRLLAFFLCWVVNTLLNHWTNLVVCIQIIT